MGFPEDDLPILIQLDGRHDTLEFWTQREAISSLETQLLAAVADDLPAPSITQPLPLPEAPPKKSSMFGRRAVKASPSLSRPQTADTSPVKVKAQLSETNFRDENEYGLYETVRGRALLVSVQVR